ncbi:MAG: hypothetical protein AAF539_03800 [Planctomycetota bacterium]
MMRSRLERDRSLLRDDFPKFSLYFVRYNERSDPDDVSEVNPPPGYLEADVVSANMSPAGVFSIQAAKHDQKREYGRLDAVLRKACKAVPFFTDTINDRIWENLPGSSSSLADVSWLAILVELEMQGLHRPKQLPSFWITHGDAESLGRLMRRTAEAGENATREFDWFIRVDDIVESSRDAVDILLDWTSEDETNSETKLTQKDYFSDHRGSGPSYGDPNPSGKHFEQDPVGAFLKECQKFVNLRQSEMLLSQSMDSLSEESLSARAEQILETQSNCFRVRNSLQSLADDVASEVIRAGKDPSPIYGIVMSAEQDANKFFEHWRVVNPLLKTVRLLTTKHNIVNECNQADVSVEEQVGTLLETLDSIGPGTTKIATPEPEVDGNEDGTESVSTDEELHLAMLASLTETQRSKVFCGRIWLTYRTAMESKGMKPHEIRRQDCFDIAVANGWPANEKELFVEYCTAGVRPKEKWTPWVLGTVGEKISLRNFLKRL